MNSSFSLSQAFGVTERAAVMLLRVIKDVFSTVLHAKLADTHKSMTAGLLLSILAHARSSKLMAGQAEVTGQCQQQ